MSKFITNLLRRKNVGREGDAGVPQCRIIEECKKVQPEDSKYWTEEQRQRLLTAPYWSANKWMEVLAKGSGNKKKVSILLETGSSRQTPVPSSHSKVIQEKRFSRNAPIDHALQDNVLLLKDFAKHVHHVGNGKELRSRVRNGLVAGGFSTKTGRQAVLFTVVNAMDDKQDSTIDQK